MKFLMRTYQEPILDNSIGPFGARFYDRAAWSSIDPLAEKYYSLSPYAFCAGNPIIFVDKMSQVLQGHQNRIMSLFLPKVMIL